MIGAAAGIALVCLTRQANSQLKSGDSVDFPADYYTAPDLAARLSRPGLIFRAATVLLKKAYLVSLPTAPAPRQLARLCSGLGLQIIDTPDGKIIAPDKAKAQADKKLRRELIDNLIVELHNQDDFILKFRDGASFNFDKDKSPDLEYNLETRRDFYKNPVSSALLDLAIGLGLPSGGDFDDTNDVSQFYSRQDEQSNVVSEFDRLVDDPPVSGLIKGLHLLFKSTGPTVGRNSVVLGADRIEGDTSYFLPQEPEDAGRSGVARRLFRGESSGFSWGNPGLSKSEKQKLRAREFQTAEVLKGLDAADPRAIVSWTNTFSSVLANLCRQVKEPVLYEIDPIDERLGIEVSESQPIGFSDLFGRGAGYTATVKDGVLEVCDELGVLQNSEVAPLASVIRVMHKKFPGKSLLELDRKGECGQLDSEDYRRILDDLDDIGQRVNWEDHVGSSELPCGVSRDSLQMSNLFIPLLEAIPKSVRMRMLVTQKKSRHLIIDNLPDLRPIIVANRIGTVIDCQLAVGAEMRSMELTDLDLDISPLNQGIFIDAEFTFAAKDNPKRNLRFEPVFTLPFDDPLFRRGN